MSSSEFLTANLRENQLRITKRSLIFEKILYMGEEIQETTGLIFGLCIIGSRKSEKVHTKEVENIAILKDH